MQIHQLSAADAIASLNSSPQGLSSVEAMRRLSEYDDISALIADEKGNYPAIGNSGCLEVVLIDPIILDPWQMASTAQRLRHAGLNVVEYAQSLPNLSAMAANLYELVRSRVLAVFPDANLRRAVTQAIATESARGWKIDKAKQSHRIDPLIALAMATLSAVEGKGVFPPPRMANFMTGESVPLGALHEHDLPTWDIGFITPWGVRVSDEVNRR